MHTSLSNDHEWHDLHATKASQGESTMGTTKTNAVKFSASKTTSEKSRQNTHVKPSREMIAEAAYHLAEKRGFAPGYALQDWFEAERIIQEQLP